MTLRTTTLMDALSRMPLEILGVLALTGCARDDAHVSIASAATTESSAHHDSVQVRRLLADSTSIDFIDGSVSRDGRFITGLDLANGNLVIRDLRTNAQRALTKTGNWAKGDNALTSRISPDGRSVAYVWSKGPPSYAFQIRVVGVDGSGDRLLRTGTTFRSTILGGWTPDSRRIVVSTSIGDADRQISVMSVADGSLQTLKSVGWRFPVGLSVSPDGRRVAYAINVERDGNTRDVYVLELDGSREVHLTNDQERKGVLGWSADGRTVYYQTRKNDAATVWRVASSGGLPASAPQIVRSDIWGFSPLGITGGTLHYAVGMRRAAVYSAEVDFQAGRETSRSAVVTTGENISMTGRVAWSPDGRRIAFVRMGPASSATSNAIVLRDLRTGDEHQIAVSLGRVQLLEWPTSASIVVIGYDRGVESRYRVDLTTGKTALIDRLIGYDEAPQHSMETRRSYLIRVDSAMGTAAVVARDDGTTTDRVLFQERLIWRAALSPNGKHIGIVALPSATESTVYVGILSATDSGHIRVVRTATGSRQIGNQLEWTPDSRTLAFVEHDIDAQTATLWKVGVAADTAVAVTTLAGASPAYAKISPDGSHVGYISLSGPRRLELWAMPNLPSSSRSTDRRP